MGFSPEELAQLGQFIEKKVADVITVARDAEQVKADVQAAVNRDAIVGKPDVAPDAGPEFYVHLANGDVIVTRDSSSTHIDVDGTSVAVIGRYQKGA